ncbi:hypothetical protein FDB28_03790 [Clostridium botulinum]|nr:hypothetical protein [Clostridium botulinum]NFS97579.1 hypothetical protein [Clostridium botulinum]
MEIKKRVQEITQKIQGIFLGNTIYQTTNYFENKEFVSEYLQDKFKLIDNYFENYEVDKVQNTLNDISLKKDKVSEKAEIILLKYQALVYVAKGDEVNLNSIVEKLKRINESKSALQEIKFNIAIKNKSYDIFNELKAEWVKENKDDKLININEIKFLFLACKYKEVIEKYDLSKYKNDKEIMNIFAISLSVEGRYEESNSILEDLKSDSEEYKLSWIFNKVKGFFSNVNYLSDVDDINELKQFTDEINCIQKEKLNKLQIKQLHIMYLQLLFFTDGVYAKEEFENIQKNYKNDYEINIIGVDILEKNSMVEEAEKLAEETLKIQKSEVIVYKILTIKSKNKKWTDVISIYNSNKSEIEDKDGICRYLYGMALIMQYGEECAYKLMKNELSEECISDLLLLAMINKNNIKKCNEYLDKICSKADNNDLTRIDASNLYIQIGNIEKAYSCLEEGAINKKIIFRQLLTLSIKEKYNYSNTLEIYRKVYISSNSIDNDMYYIAAQLKDFRLAYCISKKLFESLGNEYWTNEYIRMKLMNDDFDKIETLVKNIENSNKSEYIITAAEVYNYLENYHRADELCYKAFYYIEECSNKLDILIRINVISFKISSDNNREEESNRVNIDDIAILRDSESNILKVCLNGEIYYQDNRNIMDVIHIKMNNSLWGQLIGKNKNDLIQVNDVEYKIIDIVNKKNFMYRTAFQARIDNGEEEGIKKISIKGNSENDLDLDGMKEEIANSNKRAQRVLDMYLNQENRIGVPVYCIRNEKESIKELLESLMYSNDGRIIAGNPKVVLKDEKVVLSLLSVIILEINNLLDDFLKYYDVYIGEKLIQVLNDILKSILAKFTKKETSLYLIDNNIFIDEKDEKYKRKRIEFYQNIINKLSKAKVIDKSIIDSSLFRMSDVIVKDVDMQAIEIANDLNAVLFIDDSFTSLLANVVYKDLRISNFGGFVSTCIIFENYDKYITVVKKLVKEKYQYVFDLKALIALVFYLNVRNKKNRDKFTKFINVLLENDINEYYERILRYICLSICFKSKSYALMKTRVDIIMSCINNK